MLVERVSRKLYKRLTLSSSLDSIRMLAEVRLEALKFVSLKHGKVELCEAAWPIITATNRQ